ncbi:tetratricopeptide repeat protein [Geothrix limicola]|uniref:tetratricopeptide repeat protein n=1 Tax=Geothrix limicola TaxID=2927978 RepID=UPI003B75C276
MGIQTCPGNPFDGHTLEGQLDQVERLTGKVPNTSFVDKGYQRHGVDPGRSRVLISGTRKLGYRRALELDPNDANNTSNFALFMYNVRKNYEEGERLYRRALELDPNDADNTSSFASFMNDVRKDYDEAERLYRRALELDPNDAGNTGNFAVFMNNVRKNYDEAERLYRRALELDPNEAHHTGNLASFMNDVRKDYDEAERLFHRALELDPNDGDNIANFASFELSRGRDTEARALAVRAWNGERSTPLQCRAEAALYLLLLDRKESRPIKGGLARLKGLMVREFARGNWSFESAFQAVFPHLLENEPPFFRALGEAILDATLVQALDAFPLWSETESSDPSLPWPDSAS